MSSRWDSPPSSNPAAAAAAAAAKIAAQYGVASKSDPQSGVTASTSSGGAGGSNSSGDKRREGNEASFNEFVDINDVKNRYLITRGPTQQQIYQETGASLTTKGTWYPDRNLATADNPPLYIHVEAQSEEVLKKAIARVNEVINSEAPQLIEERGMRGPATRPPGQDSATPDGGSRDRGYPSERRRFAEEKIFINLEPLRNFNVRAKIVGPGGMFVKYIQAETGTRVQIKGRGSGFIDSDLGREADEDMHVHISGPPEGPQLPEAKRLAEDLLDAVSTEWEKARVVLEQQGFAVPPRGGYPRGGPGAGPEQGQGQGQGYQAGGYQQQQPHPQGGAYNGQSNGYNHHHQAAGGSAGYGAGSPYQSQQQQQQQQQHSGAATTTASSAQSSNPAAAASSGAQASGAADDPLTKYWKDYIAWEASFKAYHDRLPTKDEGAQDVPTQYR